MIKIQITWTTNHGRYKPLSTVIECESVKEFNTNQKKYMTTAKTRVMLRHGWDAAELKKNGYTIVKARVYDAEKIKAENADKYWALKKEKFASGEWTPSKEDKERLEKEVAERA